MSPWRTKGQHVWKARVYDRHGIAHRRSLHTEDEDEAQRIDAMCTTWRRRRQWALLDLIIERRARACDLLDAYEEGTLAAFVAALDADAADAADIDLDALVTEWGAHVQRPTYLRQVRGMIPAGARYPLSRFTRGSVSSFLAGLPHAGPTKNRYRAALRQFAGWLVEREVLTTNPVRDVRGYAEHDPRMIHYSRAQAQALVGALDQPFAALEALMAGTGMEWSAATRVRGRDIRWEKNEVWADGQKNRWRKRWVRFTEPWAWTVFAAHARTVAPNGRVFAGVAQNTALRRHHDACQALGLERSVLHDWRHTYAIYSLADHLPRQTVKRQLGHSPNSTELERVYAAWLPTTDDDYRARGAAVTAAVTAASKPQKGRGAK